MISALSWLDFSEADQRRAREIIQLFLQPESRDELGVGTVRDALSDTLFPGMSVIQTRARYFLFVPWLFIEGAGARRKKRGADLLAWVENWQRKHVEVLRESGAVEGLIGRLAGPAVKILPSTIYWNALQRFEILRLQGSQEFIAGLDSRTAFDDEALTERVARSTGIWDSALPASPPGFPDIAELTFELTNQEAQWLSERIQAATAGSGLAWLAAKGERLLDAGYGPWC